MDDLSRIIKLIIDSLPEAARYAFLYAAGFLTAVSIHFLLRKFYRSRLRIDFDYTPEYIRPTEVTLPNDEKLNSYYIRIAVSNEKQVVAKSCRVFLTDIERQTFEGEFEPTDYDDTLQLAWAGQRKGFEYAGMDLPKGIKQYLNILTTLENDEKFYLHLQRVPLKYAGLFQSKQIFSFGFLVTSANTNPQKIKMIFQWNGIWDEFKVKMDTQ